MSITEADILEQVIAPQQPEQVLAAAQAFLQFRFSAEAIERMNELAEKNRQGALTELERQAMEKYTRVGSFLNLLHANARASLIRAEPHGVGALCSQS